MLLNTGILTILASISILADARPFDTKPRAIAPRQKSYAIVNVDGGSTEVAQATSTLSTTTTVDNSSPGPTITQEVTATVVQPAPKPTPISSSTTSTSSSTTSASSSSSASTITPTSTPTITTSTVSSSAPIETPKPVFITVTVSKDDGPTEYYDNGLWHTSYPIKSFALAGAATSVSSSTGATYTQASTRDYGV